MIHIQKAGKRFRSKVKITAGHKKLIALSNEMSKAATVNLLRGIKTFKKKVSQEKVFEAWKTRDYSKIHRIIPWDDLPPHLAPLAKELGKSYNRATAFTIQGLPPPISKALRFDTKNPNIADFINRRTGELIYGIHHDTQIVVQQAVQRSLDKALTPKQVAGQIKNAIGLYPKQEQALANFRSKMESSSVPEERIDSLVDSYADRLLNQRCMTIARTEIRQVNNQGQLSVWKEAANQDLIKRGAATKIWVVDGNPCEICEPMDGQEVPLDGFWVLDDGTVCETPSDAHPNCFCDMELGFGEE